MAEDRYTVELPIKFESVENATKKLNSLTKQLNNKSEINLGININNFKEAIKAIDEISRKDFKILSDKELSKIQKLDSVLENTLKTISSLSKMNFSNADGSIKSLNKNIENTLKSLNKIKNQKGINLTGVSNSNDINKIASKELQSIQRIRKEEENLIKHQAKQQNKGLENKYNEKIKQQIQEQKALYKELNKLQQKEMSLKEQLIGKSGEELQTLKRQLEIVNQRQQTTSRQISNKSLESEELINKILKERLDLIDKIDIKQAKKNDSISKEKKELEDLINLEKKRLNLKLDKSQIGSVSKYLDENEVVKYREQIEKLNGASLKDVRSQVKDLNLEIDRMTTNAKAEKVQNEGFLSNIKNVLGGFGIAFGGAYLISSAMNELRKATETIKSTNNAMVDLKKVTDETESSYQRFKKTTHETSMELGQIATNMILATSKWAKAGEGFKDATKLAETTAILNKVGDVDINQSSEFLIAPLKAFNIEAEHSIDLVDKMNNLSNNTASDVVDIGEGMKRAAGSMAVAGNDLDKAMALITRGQETSQRGGCDTLLYEKYSHYIIKLNYVIELNA